MDNWYNSLPGGTHYVGKCKICGEPNGACVDDLCTHCLELIPVECPTCGCHYHRSHFGDSGQCLTCDEMDAEWIGTVNIPANRGGALDVTLNILNI